MKPYPNIEAWPECPTCGAAWVMRRAWSVSGGWDWIWQRDCTHRTAQPRVVGPGLKEKPKDVVA